MEKLRTMIAGNATITLQATKTNCTRMKYIALVGIPVSLLHIFIFLFFVKAHTNEEIVWRTGIIAAHTALVFIFTAAALIIFHMEKKGNTSNRMMRFILYLYILLTMLVGVGIVTLDQLVTPSITPFLVVCTIIALVFLLAPFASVPLYLLAYLVFFFAIGVTQHDPSILASNRVNGLTAIGIGIGLSFVLWKYYSNNVLQQKRIEQQNTELVKQKRNLEDANAKLAYMAAYDTLTGLFNRREFEVIVNRTLMEMKRHGHEACILAVDIDHFKRINDQYGHPAGDALLKQFSTALQKEVREIDIVARWGGEEFIIMLHNTLACDGLLVAERMRKAIENNVFIIEGQDVHITASFGVASLNSSNADPLSTAYKRSDTALYTAKNNGRNQCCLMNQEEDLS